MPVRVYAYPSLSTFISGAFEIHELDGESFLSRFYRSYPEAQSYIKRARFYARTIELRWVLNGIERNDPMWFTVHIGDAKDIGYNW
ncbi:MAG TPA: hypothetical protein VLM38_18630 [Blastocatellia bacterium]|nr:hypothetical protein [Blastocatellia bacterium]